MIRFIKVTAAEYEDLAVKNTDYFYYITDQDKFYLGTILLSEQDLSDYLTSVLAKDNSINVTNSKEIAVKISPAVGNALTVKSTSGQEGLYVDVPASTDYTVTVTETTPQGYAKAYTIAQAATGLSATINIPKDMVVSNGTVETKSESGEWGPAGTYLVLTLANASSDKIYINVSSLIEYVTAGTDTSTIHVMISSDHKVTANVIDGSIGTTQLSNGVLSSLDKANNALQSSDITVSDSQTGTNGTFSVKGTEIAIKGLKSAAYTESSSYATNAQGVLATNAVRAVTEGSENGTISVTTGTNAAINVVVHGLKSAAFTEASAYATAAQGAKADSAVQSVKSGVSNGAISVDGKDILVHGLGSAAYASTGDFDASGAADAVRGKSTDTSTSNTVYGAKAYAKSYADSLAGNYDVAGAAASAETAAKTYADSLLTWQSIN